ncbi:MobF family relaxase [Leptolyngbya sp. AN03gr2]|uniref:MobF family relaxase n=1 Tax=unclassified Leptolyngbya TaxID=2650499 RepID=UPI003D31D251
MLSLGQVHPEGSVHYFAQDDHQSDALSVETSQWSGQGAIALGLSGIVCADEFAQVLAGRSPTGEALPGRTIHSHHKAGLDLTFNAPKSISLAALMGHETDLIAAHTQAVQQVLQLVEQRYAQTRLCEAGQRQIVPTGNALIAQFLHTTSRSHDPHLHTHCVVANLTQLADQAWRSLDFTAIHNDRLLLSVLYVNALADSVRQLGYAIALRPDPSFELIGYSSSQLEHFSKRRQQILQLVGQNATTDEKQWACLATRPRKILNVDATTLDQWWQIQNDQLHLDIQHSKPDPIAMPEVAIEESLMNAIAVCHLQSPVFSQADLERRIFTHVQPFSYQSFLQALDHAQRSGQLIAIGEHYWTTPAALDRARHANELQTSDSLSSAVRAIAQGNLLTGCAQLLEQNHLIESPQSFQQIAIDYLKLNSADRAKTAIIVPDAATQIEVQQILAQVRALGAPTFHTLQQLQLKPLSFAQTLRVQSFDIGDVVVPRYSCPALGLVKGACYTVTAQNSKTIAMQDSSGKEYELNPRCFRKWVYTPVSVPIDVGDRFRWTTSDRQETFTINALTETTAVVQHLSGRIEVLPLDQSYFLTDARVLVPADLPQSNPSQLIVTATALKELAPVLKQLPTIPQSLTLFADDISALLSQVRNASARSYSHFNHDRQFTHQFTSSASSDQSAASISITDPSDRSLADERSRIDATATDRTSQLENGFRNLLDAITQRFESHLLRSIAESFDRATPSLTSGLERAQRATRSKHQWTDAIQSAINNTTAITSRIERAVRTTESLTAGVIQPTHINSIDSLIADHYDFNLRSLNGSRNLTAANSPHPDAIQSSNPRASANRGIAQPDAAAGVRSPIDTSTTIGDSIISPIASISHSITHDSSATGKTLTGAASTNSETIAAHLVTLLSDVQRWRDRQMESAIAEQLMPTLSPITTLVNSASLSQQAQLKHLLNYQQQLNLALETSLSLTSNLTSFVLNSNSHDGFNDNRHLRASPSDRAQDRADRSSSISTFHNTDHVLSRQLAAARRVVDAFRGNSPAPTPELEPTRSRLAELGRIFRDTAASLRDADGNASNDSTARSTLGSDSALPSPTTERPQQFDHGIRNLLDAVERNRQLEIFSRYSEQLGTTLRRLAEGITNGGTCLSAANAAITAVQSTPTNANSSILHAFVTSNDSVPLRRTFAASLDALVDYADRAARRDRELAVSIIDAASNPRTVSSGLERSLNNDRTSIPTIQYSDNTIARYAHFPTDPITRFANNAPQWHQTVRDVFEQFADRVTQIRSQENTEAISSELADLVGNLTPNDSCQYANLSSVHAAIATDRSNAATSITSFTAAIGRTSKCVADHLTDTRSYLTDLTRNLDQLVRTLATTTGSTDAIDHLTNAVNRAVADRRARFTESLNLAQPLPQASIFQSLENSASPNSQVFSLSVGQGRLSCVVLVDTPEDAIALAKLDIARLERSGRSLYVAGMDSTKLKELQAWVTLPEQTVINASSVQQVIPQARTLPIPSGLTWESLLRAGQQNPAQLLRHYSQGLKGEPTAMLLEAAKRALQLGQPLEVVRSMVMTSERVVKMQQFHPQQAEQYIKAILDRACKNLSERQQTTPRLIQKSEVQQS